MERRQAALILSVAPATRDHPVPGRPGPLSALHRGVFGPDPCCRLRWVGYRLLGDLPRHAL